MRFAGFSSQRLLWSLIFFVLLFLVLGGAIVLLERDRLPQEKQPSEMSFSGSVWILRAGKLFLVSATAGTTKQEEPFHLMPFPANIPYVHRLFDWKHTPEGTRFLVSFAPRPSAQNPHYQPGWDLSLLDESGNVTSLARNVLAAGLSPDVSYVAHTDASRVLHVAIVDDSPVPIAGIEGGSGEGWSPDEEQVAFAYAPNYSPGGDSGNIQIAVVSLRTGEIRELTNGHIDVLPSFHPSGDWLIFVSGTRTGLASFWKIPVVGGTPQQLTNIGLGRIDSSFVPTSQDITWSPDGNAFTYEVGRDPSSVWVVTLDQDSFKVTSADRIGEGYAPQWLDSYTIVAQTQEDNPILLQVPR